MVVCRTEVIIYVVERSPNGTSKRVPASNLFNCMETANVKSQLQQLGVMMSVTRTALSPAQLKQLLQNPPAGTHRFLCASGEVSLLTRLSISMSISMLVLLVFNIETSCVAWHFWICSRFLSGVDPIIWEQAKVDNPDPEK